MKHRDLRFDIFRGLALIAIMINHAYAEKTEFFRIAPPFFFNFAEIFVFISATVSTQSIYSLVVKNDLKTAFLKNLKRCGEIYLSLYLIVISAVLLVDFLNHISPNLVNLSQLNFLGLSPFMPLSPKSLFQLFTLQSLPSFCHVLILYLFFLPVAPFAISLAKHRPRLLILSSVTLYLYAQFVPLKGETANVFFDPFRSFEIWHHPLAYQLIFTIGIFTGIWMKEKRNVLAHIPTAVFLYTSLAIMALYLGFGDHQALKAFSNPQNSGLLRVMGFIAVLGLFAKTTSSNQSIWQSPIALFLSRLGQKSLRLFALGVLWSEALIVIQEHHMHLYQGNTLMILMSFWTIFAIYSMYLLSLSPKNIWQDVPVLQSKEKLII